MKTTLKTPEFKTEKEEAAWFDAHPDELFLQFKQAAADGLLRKGTLARRGLTPKTSIRIAPADIEMAKAQAEKLGIGYQTYLKMIIHQALSNAQQA